MLIPEWVRSYAKKYGFSPSCIRVEETTRWGYCTRNGEVVINWRLITLPEELAEYVILHELTHLQFFSHSKKFRENLAKLCPDHAERRRRLGAYSPD
jgi:predicted metal-dependent hydrolase